MLVSEYNWFPGPRLSVEVISQELNYVAACGERTVRVIDIGRLPIETLSEKRIYQCMQSPTPCDGRWKMPRFCKGLLLFGCPEALEPSALEYHKAAIRPKDVREGKWGKAHVA